MLYLAVHRNSPGRSKLSQPFSYAMRYSPGLLCNAVTASNTFGGICEYYIFLLTWMTEDLGQKHFKHYISEHNFPVLFLGGLSKLAFPGNNSTSLGLLQAEKAL